MTSIHWLRGLRLDVRDKVLNRLEEMKYLALRYREGDALLRADFPDVSVLGSYVELKAKSIALDEFLTRIDLGDSPECASEVASIKAQVVVADWNDKRLPYQAFRGPEGVRVFLTDLVNQCNNP